MSASGSYDSSKRESVGGAGVSIPATVSAALKVSFAFRTGALFEDNQEPSTSAVTITIASTNISRAKDSQSIAVFLLKFWRCI